MGLRDMLKSAGEATTSVSKVIFFGGFLVVSGIMIYQTYLDKLSSDFFFWYILSTFGSNTLNKAISVSGQVLTQNKKIEVLGSASQETYNDSLTQDNELEDTTESEPNQFQEFVKLSNLSGYSSVNYKVGVTPSKDDVK